MEDERDRRPSSFRSDNMLRETELDELTETRDDNNTNRHQAYSTPSERNSQDKPLHLLIPKKNKDTSLRSTQRKLNKRPDIPIYVPKPRRELDNNIVFNSNSTATTSTTNKSLHITTSTTQKKIPDILNYVQKARRGLDNNISDSSSTTNTSTTGNSLHITTSTTQKKIPDIPINVPKPRRELDNNIVFNSNSTSTTSTTSTTNKSLHITTSTTQKKIPDIPNYVPKARRLLDNNISDSSSTTNTSTTANSLHITTSTTQKKIPDIPNYVPKARRGLDNDVSNSSSTTNTSTTGNSLHIITSTTQKKIPDIPNYVPKARRGLDNDVSNSSSTTNTSTTGNCLHITTSTTPVNVYRTQDKTTELLRAKRLQLSTQNSHIKPVSLDSFNFVNLSSDAIMKNANGNYLSLFNRSSSQIIEPLTSNSFYITSSDTPITNSKTNGDTSDELCSKELKDTLPKQNIINQQHTLDLSPLDSFGPVETIIKDVKAYQTSYNNISSQISECLPSNSLSNDVNEIVKVGNSVINQNESEINIVIASLNNCNNKLKGLPQCLFDKSVSIFSQKSMPDNLKDVQTQDMYSNNTADNLPELVIKKLDDQKIVATFVEPVNENNIIEYNKQNCEMQIEKELANTSDVELYTEYNFDFPHYYSNDSSTSDLLLDVEEKNSIGKNEKLFLQEDSKSDDNKMDMNKKKQKKKNLDLNECSSWEDLYDKKNKDIHPLLIKKIVSTMGNVQVNCTQEDYSSYQTVEERSANHCTSAVKNKTPMCLVNDLARFNKIKNIYKLTNEQGPQQKKKFTVALKLGKEEYIADAISIKKAQHAAAAIALAKTNYKPPPAKTKLKAELNVLPIKQREQTLYTVIEEVLKSGQSATSQVHQIALKMKLPIQYEVLEEDGLPHMKTYIIKCTVGTYNAIGEGNGKKLSKLRAAEKMLQILKEANDYILEEDITPTLQLPQKKRYKMSKKNNKNLIMETKPYSKIIKPIDNTYQIEDTDPITKIYKIQAAKKEKEPLFVLKEDIRHPDSKMEFIFEVLAGQFSALGKGPNKKDAKRNAAKNLLIEMGHESELKRNSVKKNDIVLASHKNKTNINSPHKTGRRIVPGYMANDSSTANFQSIKQLDHFSQMFGFKLHYSDFPLFDMPDVEYTEPKMYKIRLKENINPNFGQGDRGGYKSMVVLSMPPQICHGSGSTTKRSRNAAARNAVRTLINLNILENQ